MCTSVKWRSFSDTAAYIATGTLTRPNPIDPFQIARGMPPAVPGRRVAETPALTDPVGQLVEHRAHRLDLLAPGWHRRAPRPPRRLFELVRAARQATFAPARSASPARGRVAPAPVARARPASCAHAGAFGLAARGAGVARPAPQCSGTPRTTTPRTAPLTIVSGRSSASSHRRRPARHASTSRPSASKATAVPRSFRRRGRFFTGNRRCVAAGLQQQLLVGADVGEPALAGRQRLQQRVARHGRRHRHRRRRPDPFHLDRVDCDARQASPASGRCEAPASVPRADSSIVSPVRRGRVIGRLIDAGQPAGGSSPSG